MVYCSVAFKSELDSQLKHSHSQTRDTKCISFCKLKKALTITTMRGTYQSYSCETCVRGKTCTDKSHRKRLKKKCRVSIECLKEGNNVRAASQMNKIESKGENVAICAEGNVGEMHWQRSRRGREGNKKRNVRSRWSTQTDGSSWRDVLLWLQNTKRIPLNKTIIGSGRRGTAIHMHT